MPVRNVHHPNYRFVFDKVRDLLSCRFTIVKMWDFLAPQYQIFHSEHFTKWVNAIGAAIDYDYKKTKWVNAIGAAIDYDYKKPLYDVGDDTIFMMPRERFPYGLHSYETALLHELAHWTGHPSRLDRFVYGLIGVEGKVTYGREEIVADLACAFLSNYHGVPEPLEKRAAYIGMFLRDHFDNNMHILDQVYRDAVSAAVYLIHKANGENPIECRREARNAAEEYACSR